MRILAIDTALDACSAAIVEGEQTRFREISIIGKGHAEVLPPMIARALGETGLRAADLDRIGVIVGPGAFAGVRVGLAFARAFCLGAGAQAVGVTSLEALAGGLASDPRPTAGVIDARRGQVYAALFDAMGRELIAPFVASPEAAAARLVEAAPALRLVGSGAALLAPFAPDAGIFACEAIDPVVAAKIAAGKSPKGPPAPLYLRPPDAQPQGGSLFDGLT
jgi:tRNA threonylcarbamoyladenosine biosynthesis protein TsaB